MPLCATRADGYLYPMECDVLISGGGIAGLIAAAAFGSAGFSVVCVDPAPPVTDRAAKGADLRTTAILGPGRTLLETAGLWDALAPHATPLEVMRIVDAGGPEANMRRIKDFRASDIAQDAFGWNLPNWFLRRTLVAQLNTLPKVDFRPAVATTGYFGRTDMARVRLSDGSQIKTRLVIAADGRNSPMRQAASIDVRTQRYGQKALAFSVTHPVPHNNISTEIHRTGGPFTLVPLPDHDGQPCSAVVWMDDGPLQIMRQNLDADSFNHAITERSCQALGALTLASPRSLWPIISQQARRLTAPRLALIAEAAHVVPPIGAQGLNMSLKDTATLLEQANTHPETLGNADMLAQYERLRMPDIRLRAAGIDLLNRASQVTSPLLRDARGLALDALYSAGPLRKLLMEMGLGTRALR